VTSEVEYLWLIVGLSAGLGLLLVVVIVVVVLCRTLGGKPGEFNVDIELDQDDQRGAAINAATGDDPQYHDNGGLNRENVQHSDVDPDGRNRSDHNYLTPTAPDHSYPTPSGANTNHTYLAPYEPNQIPGYLEIISDYQ